MKRRYRIRHSTVYKYQEPTDLSYNQLCLTPRTLPGQAVLQHSLTISPQPVANRTHEDGFGNKVTYFEINQAHEEMEILAESLVEIDTMVAGAEQLAIGPAWETVQKQAGETPSAVLFTLPAGIVKCSQALRTYAAPSFPAGRSLREGALDLMSRIHADFEFDPAATTVATPIDEVLKSRRGVCQDFAHLGISCLRSLGLPARYVSGYIETVPPPGKERLVGADASHAWLSVLDPVSGWLDLDPTNDQVPSGRHITVAVGRDYSDVVPVRGLAVGSGDHQLKVAVDVAPVTAW